MKLYLYFFNTKVIMKLEKKANKPERKPTKHLDTYLNDQQARFVKFVNK